MHPDDLQIALAQEAATLAAACAVSLAELGLLLPGRSEEVEATLLRVANLCRSAGADVEETRVRGYAEQVQHWREALPPPRHEPGR